jgi:hypothetical protein
MHDKPSTDNTPGPARWRAWAWLVGLFALCVGVGAWWASPSPPAPLLAPAAPALAPPQARVGVAVRVGVLVGQVTGPDGAPVAGAQVTAARLGRLEEGAARALTATTDAEGRFRLGPTRRLGHQLRVEAAGFVPLTLPRALPGDAPLSLSLAPGDGVRGALSWEGAPVEGARVLIAGPGLWPPVEAQSDAQGAFQSASLEPGTYQLLALRGARGDQPPLAALAQVEHHANDPTPFALALEPARAPRICATSAPGGEPLANALISASPEALDTLSLSAWTDEAGCATLPALPPGAWWLRARAWDHEAHAGPLPEGGDATLALHRAARLQGVAQDERGEPLELVRAQVHVVSEEGQQWIIDRDLTAKVSPRAAPGGQLAPSFAAAFGFFSDADGRFEVSGLPAGQVTLTLTREGYAAAVLGPWRVARGQALTIPAVALGRGYPLEGRVEGPDGQPLAAAWIAARPAEAPADDGGPLPGLIALRDRERATDEAGRFSLRDLPRRVTLTAQAPGYLETALTLDLEAHGAEPLALVLAAPGALTHGVVSRQGEAPIEGAWLRYLPSPGQRALRADACAASTDHRGRFALAACPDEPFWVEITAPDAPTAYARITPGQEAEISLDAPRALTVRALDTQREPVPGAAVTLTAQNANRDLPAWLQTRQARTLQTDARGLARHGALSAGRWDILIETNGFQTWRGEAALGEARGSGEGAEVVAELKPSLRLRGAVSDRYGAPIEGAFVTVWAPGERAQELVSGARGVFEVTLSSPGEVSARAVHPERGSGRAVRRVPEAGDDEALVIELTEATADLARWREALEGAGLELWEDGARVVLEGVAPESAAARGGARRGDVLLGVEEGEASGLRLWVAREGEDLRLQLGR